MSRVKSANKQRDALEALVEVVERWKYHLPSAIRDSELANALKKAKSALSEPPHYCDVGTSKEHAEVTLEIIDEVDFGFATNILCRAKLVSESLGSSHDVCAVNRDRYREDAKMAKQWRQMMYEAKKGGNDGNK